MSLFMCNFHEFLHIGTPTYSFPELEEKNDIFSLKEGSSDQLNFSVFCRPPLEANERHLLSKKDSPVVENRVYIEGSSICFRSVKRSDAGRYTVTSTNSAGQGQRSFYLQVRCKQFNSDTIICIKKNSCVYSPSNILSGSGLSPSHCWFQYQREFHCHLIPSAD